MMPEVCVSLIRSVTVQTALGVDWEECEEVQTVCVDNPFKHFALKRRENEQRQGRKIE